MDVGSSVAAAPSLIPYPSGRATAASPGKWRTEGGALRRLLLLHGLGGDGVSAGLGGGGGLALALLGGGLLGLGRLGLAGVDGVLLLGGLGGSDLLGLLLGGGLKGGGAEAAR